MDNWVRLPFHKDDKITLKPYVDFRAPIDFGAPHPGYGWYSENQPEKGVYVTELSAEKMDAERVYVE